MGVSQNQGYLFGGPCDKVCSIFRGLSILGLPYVPHKTIWVFVSHGSQSVPGYVTLGPLQWIQELEEP